VGGVVAFLAAALTLWIISDRSAGDVVGIAAASTVGVTVVLVVLRLTRRARRDIRADGS
jgi:hypothetical protein